MRDIKGGLHVHEKQAGWADVHLPNAVGHGITCPTMRLGSIAK